MLDSYLRLFVISNGNLESHFDQGSLAALRHRDLDVESQDDGPGGDGGNGLLRWGGKSENDKESSTYGSLRRRSGSRAWASRSFCSHRASSR